MSERRDPPRVGACGEVAFGVDQRVQLHRDSGVDVGPFAVGAEHLHVQPEVAVGVRVERTRATVVELDDLDAGDVFPDESAVAATSVELV
jgi:hypothetical protein